MEANDIPLSAIDPSLLNWSVVLRAIEVTHTKKGPSAHQILRTFILADDQGLRVTVYAAEDMIQQFATLLMPFKKYCISKAAVRQPRTYADTDEYPFYWLLTPNTIIHEIQEPVPSFPFYFHLNPFSMIDIFADTHHLLNVMGVVVHILPPKTTPFHGSPSISRDYVIIDQIMKPMILTLWNEFEEIDGPIIRAPGRHFPIVIAIRVNLTTNNYLSFSTCHCSTIMVAPFAQQAMHLDHWYHNHALAIHKLVDKGSYTDPRVLLPPVTGDRILHISAALQQRTNTTWIRGIIEISLRPQKLFYMACPQCNQPNSFAITWIVRCRYCQATVELLPRACITISIADSTGSLAATAMGSEAEKLINYSTAELHYLYEERVEITSHLMRTLHGKTNLFYIKPSSSRFASIRCAAYEIITSYAMDGAMNINNVNFNGLNINN